MPDQGDGSYALPNAPFAAGTPIASAPVNGNFADLAAAMSARLRVAQTTPFSRALLDDPGAAEARATLGMGTPAAILALAGATNALVPPGAVMMFARAAPPPGWLEANGALVNRADFPALWAAVAAEAVAEAAWAGGAQGRFGVGNGATTFRLPELRGEFLRGWDNGRGQDAGRSLGAHQASQNLAHAHGVNDPGHAHGRGFNDPVDTFGFQGGGNVFVRPLQNATLPAATNITIQSDGGAEARPRNVALLVCVKS